MTGSIFTVGHGARSEADLIRVLEANQVGLLVDVRRFPGSRKHPHFGQKALESSLKAHGIRYVWLGMELGGRRNKLKSDSPHSAIRVPAFRNYADFMNTDDFPSGVEKLKQICQEQRTQTEAPPATAFMCSETCWWSCHRKMISDQLVASGWKVNHIGLNAKNPTAETPHVLWEIARATSQGLIYDQVLPTKKKRKHKDEEKETEQQSGCKRARSTMHANSRHD
jgi:uncharacterized protein (DUF488 family)